MRIEIDPQKQAVAQQIADTDREISMSVSSDEEKELKKSIEKIVDDLNHLGVPYFLQVILPTELERGSIGSLQYNNFSGQILNIQTEEDKQKLESVIRYCEANFIRDCLRFFINDYNVDSTFPSIFATFTHKVFYIFNYSLSNLIRQDKSFVVQYFKDLISKKTS